MASDLSKQFLNAYADMQQNGGGSDIQSLVKENQERRKLLKGNMSSRDALQAFDEMAKPQQKVQPKQQINEAQVRTKKIAALIVVKKEMEKFFENNDSYEITVNNIKKIVNSL